MRSQTKAYVALIFICIVWGTTYLAIKVGVMHYPAFLFAGVRQTISGVILMSAALIINRKTDLSAKNILRQMLVGFLMLTLGNGCVTFGEKTVPSGISALICSFMPIFAVLFNLMFSGKEKFNWLIAAGMVLGTCGVGMIFMHNTANDTSSGSYLVGVLCTLLATCSWALGSIVNKKNADPVNAFLNSGMQLLFGGLFMLIISPVVDDLHHVVLWNRDGIIALVYLIIFGSVLAYAAYMYALSKLPVGIATIYAYINPMVAVAVGFFVGEKFNVYIGIAFVAILLSVFMVNRGYRMQHKQSIPESKMAEAFPGEVPLES